MKYIAKIEQSATQSPSYIQTIEFDAATDDELAELVYTYASGGEHLCQSLIKVDNSLMPKRFNESGGFASRLLSFVDETGRDVRHLGEELG